jgi:hypothetical protein
LKVPPKQGDKQSKTFDGKTFFWCKAHSRWGRHTTNECKKGQPGGQQTKQSNNQEQNKAGNKTIRFAESMAAVLDDDEPEQL